MPKKIAIYGYYGHNNAGDEAFKLVFAKHFRGRDMVFFGPSDIPNFEDQYDVIVLGGGNVLGEYFLEPLISRGWINCPIRLAMGVGLSDSSGLELTRQMNFSLVGVRNSSELVKLSDLSGVIAIPDLVFGLDGSQFACAEVPAIKIEYKKNRSIGIVVSMEYFPEMNDGERFEKYLSLDRSIELLSSFVEKIRTQYNVFIAVISSDIYHYDEVYARLLYRACPNAWKNVAIFNCNGDAETAIASMKNYEAVISMKFHGLVFGILSGCPVINISQNIKNRDLINDLGLEDLTFDLLGRDSMAEDLVELVGKAVAHKSVFEEYARTSRLEVMNCFLKAESAIGAI